MCLFICFDFFWRGGGTFCLVLFIAAVAFLPFLCFLKVERTSVVSLNYN